MVLFVDPDGQAAVRGLGQHLAPEALSVFGLWVVATVLIQRLVVMIVLAINHQL